MARTQTLVQLNDELLALLDERASRERRSRSTLIREALEMFLREELEDAVGRRIVEGYRRIPQTCEEDAWAQSAARDAIREEPW
ncbi:MAG: ribbon-helix-helix protein, CopG family [Solirubrobacteraceae bacterium MAG38_C4-C5]|nr:ribbon-helix-helix protein, CopG family [Candidatus Siliceabacter maunaloa]